MRIKKAWLTLIDPRQTGRTHALCAAAKFIDATVVCASVQEAKRLHDAYDVETLSINQDLNGHVGPLFYDHELVRQIEAHALVLEGRVDRLVSRLAAAKRAAQGIIQLQE